MKSIKITLTPEQRIQLAHAENLEIDLPDYDQLANELQSAKNTLAAITALLNPNGYTGLSLPDSLWQRITEAACDGFQAGFDASGEGFNGEYGCFTDKSVQRLIQKRDNWLAESGHKKAP